MVSFPGDTLFSYYGYKTSTYIVPDTLEENRHIICFNKIPLICQRLLFTLGLEEDQYLIELKLYDDAIRRAQRELSGESLAFVAARLDADASLQVG